ncbi:MAG: DUF3536 domain-containing protein [Gemmatimonadetes bacterium]|nr:DUF3536 domain-containing protein [Gemmatimonadota bacterium]NIR81046.1 DUF3536 domain-containing protein [Gemmatimonadota bacterium]NIT89864.1 DUF3536 domain-containing protein [Gemmatimonadota bacterium]NIU33663.1 DUF3536 domain-containing protein [Gemmatimonadota bacterium]NIU37906.1 DUF3536 domain-containing protein [Gemmatimonadota bacterium]
MAGGAPGRPGRARRRVAPPLRGGRGRSLRGSLGGEGRVRGGPGRRPGDPEGDGGAPRRPSPGRRRGGAGAHPPGDGAGCAPHTSCGWFFDDLAGLEPLQVLSATRPTPWTPSTDWEGRRRSWRGSSAVASPRRRAAIRRPGTAGGSGTT